MRKFVIGILFCCICTTLFSQEREPYRIPPRKSMTTAIKSVPVLYKEGSAESCTKADETLLSIFEDMEWNPEARNYACWGWTKGGPNRDLNMPLFAAPYLFIDIWPWMERMSAEVKEKFLQVCHAVVTAADRRFAEEIFPEGRAEIEYSNAFCMTIETFALAAWRTGDKSLKEKAAELWSRLYGYYRFHGLGEFMSTHYDQVDFCSILNFYKYIGDEELAKEAKYVLDRMYISELGASHPLLKISTVGSSRDYRDFLEKEDARCEIIRNTPDGYIVPEEAAELQDHRSYPFEMEGKAGKLAFTYKSYQLEDAAMGSMTGWGNYFWQQLHLIAAAGKSGAERAVLFVPGSNNPVNGYSDQKGMNAMVVYNHKPTLWHISLDRYDVRRTQDPFGIGASEQFEEIQNFDGHLILRAYGYDFHIFAFCENNGSASQCNLSKNNRTTTSPSGRYHKRARAFTEYTFPVSPEWVGAVIKIVKEGESIRTPAVYFSESDGITSFSCKSEKLQIRVGMAECGASVALRQFNTDTMSVNSLTKALPQHEYNGTAVHRDDVEATSDYLDSVLDLVRQAASPDSERIKRTALTSWYRFYQHYKVYGFGEFTDPSSMDRSFDALMEIWRNSWDGKMKLQVKEVQDRLFTIQLMMSHPVLGLPLAGASGSGREFVRNAEARPRLLYQIPADYEVPDAAKKLMNRRKYPFSAEGKGGSFPFVYTTFQLADAGMGSMTGWGAYGKNQIHLIAASGHSAGERSVLFMPGSDCPLNGYVDQTGMNALVVYNRKPTLSSLTGKDDPSLYASVPLGIGISGDFREISNTKGHLVLTAHGYDYHVFPFVLEGDAVCNVLLKRERCDSGFEQYRFPDSKLWSGALVRVQKSGTKAKSPYIVHNRSNGIDSFASEGDKLMVKVGETAQGAGVTLREKQVAIIPMIR